MAASLERTTLGMSKENKRGDREYIMVSSFFAYISLHFMEVKLNDKTRANRFTIGL